MEDAPGTSWDQNYSQTAKSRHSRTYQHHHTISTTATIMSASNEDTFHRSHHGDTVIAADPSSLSALGATSSPLDTMRSPTDMAVNMVGMNDALMSPLLSDQDGNSNSDAPPASHASPHTSSPAAENEDDFVRSVLVRVWKKMYNIVPFVLLFCAKMLHDHSIGLLVLIGMTGTFCYADVTLKKCISQRELNRNVVFQLIWILTFLIGSIALLYYVFDDQQLYKGLYCLLPKLTTFDAWNLFWCVLVTDYTLKYITICIKAGITLIPKSLLSIKKKGPLYLLIEQTSQFYRLFPPTTAWIMLLTDNQTSGKDWYNAILVIIYVLVKAFVVWCTLKHWREAWARFRVDLTYWTKPCQEELQAGGNQCPICHDSFNDPVQLQCKHIFCEECVALWFDRERTCPMCRATVVEDPAWRDGSTTSLWQIY